MFNGDLWAFVVERQNPLGLGTQRAVVPSTAVSLPEGWQFAKEFGEPERECVTAEVHSNNPLAVHEACRRLSANYPDIVEAI